MRLHWFIRIPWFQRQRQDNLAEIFVDLEDPWRVAPEIAEMQFRGFFMQNITIVLTDMECYNGFMKCRESRR